MLILFQLFDSLTQSKNLSVFLLLEKVQLLENRVQPRNRISSWSVKKIDKSISRGHEHQSMMETLTLTPHCASPAIKKVLAGINENAVIRVQAPKKFKIHIQIIIRF